MKLVASLGSYPHTEALKTGAIRLDGYEVEFADVAVTGGFRRMMRDLEYDFCELGITAYLSGWDYDNKLTSIPVFPARDFPFRSIQVNSEAGIESPKDLEGRRVACRTYTVTSVVWARGMLADLYDVDSDSITWVVNDMEHTEGFVWPANVEYIPNADLSGMVESGQVAAGFGVVQGEVANVRPLFPDPAAAEREWYSKSGIYPINHSIALPLSLLEREPALAERLASYFAAGKDVLLDRLAAGVDLSEAERALERRQAVVGADPFPYGIAANRPALEALLRYSYDQHIVGEKLTFEEIFVPGSD